MVTDYMNLFFMSLSSCSLPAFLLSFSNLFNNLQELSAEGNMLAAYPVHIPCVMRDVIIQQACSGLEHMITTASHPPGKSSMC